MEICEVKNALIILLQSATYFKDQRYKIWNIN